MQKFFLSVWLLANLLAAGAGHAQIVLPTSGGEKQLNALIDKSAVIIEGKAGLGYYCFWDAAHKAIYTATPITVYKVFKGELVGSTIEIITYGGQVGGSAAGCKDCNEPQLGRVPTGVFFLTPAAHPDPRKTGAAGQAFKVTDGKFGFFQYLGEQAAEDQAHAHWRTYSHVETDLYPAITARTQQKYRDVEAFDPKQYNSLLDLQEQYRVEMGIAPKAPIKPTSNKKKAPTNGGAGLNSPVLRPQAVVVSSFFPTSVTAGTFDSITINGSGFGNYNPNQVVKVQFLNADDLVSYIDTPFENISRFSTDTKIIVYVPSNNGSAPGFLGSGAASGFIKVTNGAGGATVTSTNRVTIPRSEFTLNYIKPNGTVLAPKAYRQLRLTNRDGSGGMRFKYDANILSSRPRSVVPPVKAIEAAIRKWRCKTTINLGDNPFLPVPFSDDSIDCNIAFANLPPTVLMATTHRFSYCRGTNGLYVYISAIDIAISKGNPNIIWSYDLTNAPIATDSSRYDFKTALLHELGHGVGLDHVADINKLMYPSINPADQRDTLSTEPELNGGANILRRSALTNRCYAPMIPLTSASCTGARVTVNPFRIFHTSCQNPTPTTVTASGATAYKWYPAPEFGNTNPTTAAVSVTVTATYRPQVYVFGVKDGLGDIAYPTYKGMPCQPLSFAANGDAPETQVYPNPSSTGFAVTYTLAAPTQWLELTLYNAQGTVLHTHRAEASAATATQTYPLPKLPAGVYFLRTAADGRPHEVLQLRAE